MQRISHKQNSLFNYGYQGKEKPSDGSLWDQFELRLYNHDLGRWFAPDPYNQFHSPYVGMANNPVNAVDPDGGYVMMDDQGRRFVNKELMDRQRESGTGGFAYKYVKARYEDQVESLAKQYGMGQGSKNRSGDNYSEMGDVAGFLAALRILNNEAQGLGLSGTQLENGQDYTSQNENILFAGDIIATRESLGGPDADGGINHGLNYTGDKRGFTLDDKVYSTSDGYEMQEAEKTAILNSFDRPGLFDGIMNNSTSSAPGVSHEPINLKISFGWINKMFRNSGQAAYIRISIGANVVNKEWVMFGQVHNNSTNPNGFIVDEVLRENERVHYYGGGDYQSHIGGVGSGGGLRGTKDSPAYYHLNVPKGTDRTWRYYKEVRSIETTWKPFKLKIWWDRGTR